jgi:hypothetical protein
MVTVSALRVSVIVFLTLAAKADTITTRDSRTWNGTVTSLQGSLLVLQAGTPGSKAATPLSFGSNYVRAIEFNSTTYNPSAIPTPPQPAGGNFSGTVYTRDKKAHPCTNIGVNQKQITCGGKPIPAGNPGKSVALGDVIRIMIDAQ